MTTRNQNIKHKTFKKTHTHYDGPPLSYHGASMHPICVDIVHFSRVCICCELISALLWSCESSNMQTAHLLAQHSNTGLVVCLCSSTCLTSSSRLQISYLSVLNSLCAYLKLTSPIQQEVQEQKMKPIGVSGTASTASNKVRIEYCTS